MPFCATCGAALNAGATFCTACGAQVPSPPTGDAMQAGEPAVARPPARPVGITMIGFIALVGGAIAAVGALASFLFLLVGVGLGNPVGVLLGAFALVLLVVSAVLGIVGLITGWGLLKGRAWARLALLVLLGLNAAGALSSFISGGDGAVGLVGLTVSAIVAWYLFRPEVKAWFAPK